MEISPRTALSYERLDALCRSGRQIRSDHLRSILLTAFSSRLAREQRPSGRPRLLRNAIDRAAPDGAPPAPSNGAIRVWLITLIGRRAV